MVRLVTFAIIGAEKCGTTWLHYTLRQHRQIYMPLEETKYFSAALDEMGSYEDHFEAREFDAKLEARWYRDAPPEALALGDKSPSYFTHVVAVYSRVSQAEVGVLRAGCWCWALLDA